jgi:NADH-quinone oxidoreductase subunit A
MATPTAIVAYLALFAAVGFGFLFVNLLVGRFLRPVLPNEEKLEVYECGEPTIGSSFVQFDLRFYVVALLFIIFDVEVAFFFPWAAVFGTSTNMMDEDFKKVQAAHNGAVVLTDDADKLHQELGVREPAPPTTVPATLADQDEGAFGAGSAAGPVQTMQQAEFVIEEGSRQLVWWTIVDIGVFFAVLVVCVAYVLRRGDLNWVRAISRETSSERSDRAPPEAAVPEEEPALSA